MRRHAQVHTASSIPKRVTENVNRRLQHLTMNHQRLIPLPGMASKLNDCAQVVANQLTST